MLLLLIIIVFLLLLTAFMVFMLPSAIKQHIDNGNRAVLKALSEEEI